MTKCSSHPVISSSAILILSLAACGKAVEITGGPGDGGGDELAGGDPVFGDVNGADPAPGDGSAGDGLTPGDRGAGDDFHGLTCSSCHGNATNAAPPIGLGGTTDTTATGVGAHQNHLALTSDWHKVIACDECHLVPQNLGDPGHIDTPRPAELTWGPLAEADSASSSWTPATPPATGGTCNTYCHGQTLSGGTHTRPAWTLVGTGEADCGTCHGLPPTTAHPSSTNCVSCHGEVIAAGNTTFVAPEKHIDGIVEVATYHPTGWEDPASHGAGFLATPTLCSACHGDALDGGTTGISCETCHPGWQTDCSFCHGSVTNAAPPRSVAGSMLVSTRGVGTHQSHLKTSSLEHRLVQCNDCHLVPTTLLAAGHIDTPLPAELTWSALAKTGTGATPGFDGTRCNNVYCHGDRFTPAGPLTKPEWTKLSPQQAACGTCHTNPPAGGHPQLTNCNQCHAEVVNSDNTTFAAPQKHVDGTVQAVRVHTDPNWALPTAHGTTFNAGQPSACTTCHGATLAGGAVGVSCETCHAGWQTNCVFCHGGQDNQTGAPPYGVDGETARTTLQVGAHSKHVVDTTIQRGRNCTLCHVKPADIFSTGHLDDSGRATVTSTGLAAGTSYNTTSGVCTTNYCHGNGQTGSTGSADWNAPGQLSCSSCHNDNTTPQGSFNMSGQHYKHVYEEGRGCFECHAGVVNSSKVIIDLSLHVNGSRDVLLDQGGTWSPPPTNGGRGLCDPTCHEGEGVGAQPWY